MSFLDKVRSLLKSGLPYYSQVKRVPNGYQYITRDINPSDFWEIIGELGDGAFGKVQKVKHRQTEVLAAAKSIELSAEEDMDSFLVEIEILKECQHKNIVGLYETFYVNHTLWLYLEFCGGGALDSLMIELEKNLSEAQIRYVCHEMCEGLRFLHGCFVIHRDLKAGNVLLTSDGQVKLADFGVSAKNKAENQKRDSFIGTPYWMAPEVIMCETFKDDPYNCKADIWSFGITLIELAQRDPPYSEMSPNRVVIKIQKSDPPTLCNSLKWSKDFADFLKKCLQKRPDDRWSASDLLSHPFCRNANDPKPVKELLLELKADIIEEHVNHIDEDSQSMDSAVTPELNSLAESQTESDFFELSKESCHDQTISLTSDNLAGPDFFCNAKNDTKRLSIDSKYWNAMNSSTNTEEFDSNLTVDLTLKESPCSEFFAAQKTKTNLVTVNGQEIFGDSANRLSTDFFNKITASKKSQSSRDFDPKRTEISTEDHYESNDFSAEVELVICDLVNQIIEQLSWKTLGFYPEIEQPILQRGANNKPAISISRSDTKTEIQILDDVTDAKMNTENFEKFPNEISPCAIDLSVSVFTDDCIKNRAASRLNSGDLLSRSTFESDLSDFNATLPNDEISMGVSLNDKGDDTSNAGNKNDGVVPNETTDVSRSATKFTKKTRVYVVDGVQVTSSTYHVMAESGHKYKAKEDFNLRKAELQELKRLQKEETKQFQCLAMKTQMLREQQDRKFDENFQELVKQYDFDLEAISKHSRKQIEEFERLQEEDLRFSSKKIRHDQEKEMKSFKDILKQEHKLLKQEIDILPKNDRKEALKHRKEVLDVAHADRERSFVEILRRNHDSAVQRLNESHHQKIALLETQFLQQKHQLLKAREAAIWALEEKQLHERHQMAKNQIKEIFFLQRNHMLVRHQREIEHMRKVIVRKEDDLLRAQLAERKRLPKILRQESKTRTMMFRESLKIKKIEGSDLGCKVREFEELERKREQRESKKQEMKHKKRLDQLKADNEASMCELQQIQNEKRKMLFEHEGIKLKQYDEDYAADMKKWRIQLKNRKQVLEDKCKLELKENSPSLEETRTPAMVPSREISLTTSGP